MPDAIPKSAKSIKSELLIKAQDSTHYFLLLEGDSDLRFWEEHLNHQAIKPVECGGKPVLLEVFVLLDGDPLENRVLGLVDADFDCLLNNQLPHPNLVHTDKNDLETSLLSLQVNASNQTMLEKLIVHSVEQAKKKAFEKSQGLRLDQYILSIARQFGTLRYLNQCYQWNVNFNKLSVWNKQWMDHQTITLDSAALHEAMRKKIANNIDLATLQTSIQMCFKQYSLKCWELVHGHDLMQLTALVFNSKLLCKNSGHTRVSETSLQRDLRLMVRWEDMQACQMVQTIQLKAPNNVQFFKVE